MEDFKGMKFTRPAWLDQPNPLQQPAFAKEHWQATQSLRLFALALADISPDRDELLVAYRARLAEYERTTGHALLSLFRDE